MYHKKGIFFDINYGPVTTIVAYVISYTNMHPSLVKILLRFDFIKAHLSSLASFQLI